MSYPRKFFRKYSPNIRASDTLPPEGVGEDLLLEEELREIDRAEVNLLLHPGSGSSLDEPVGKKCKGETRGRRD